MKSKNPFSVQAVYAQGSEAEIGQALAEAFAPTLDEGMYGFLMELWGNLTQSKRFSSLEKMPIFLASQALSHGLIPKLYGNLPLEAKARMRGFQANVKKSKSSLYKAMMLPDVFPILMGWMKATKPYPFVNPMSVSFGCSSFISKGEKFLHGRNLDFPGVGAWDRHPRVIVLKPKDKLAYVSIASSGMFLGSVTGINEAQVSIGIHQHYSTQVSLKGIPPFVLAEKILAEARSCKEAIAILEKYPLCSSWAFIISDGKTQEGILVEKTPKVMGIKNLNTLLVHTNYFQTEACKNADEFSCSAKMNWDNQSRYARLENCVKRENLTEQEALAGLSECWDPYWAREKVWNRTVSQLFNVQSVLMDPVAMKVWIGEGVSPLHLGKYFEWSVHDLLVGKEGCADKGLPGYVFKNPQVREAKKLVIEGFQAALKEKDEVCVARLLEAQQHVYTPEADLALGILFLKLEYYQKSEFHLSRAIDFIEKEGIGEKMPPEYFEALLYLGRLFSIQGKKDLAQKNLDKMVGHPDLEDSHLKALAMKKTVFTDGQRRKLFAPFSTYAPFQ